MRNDKVAKVRNSMQRNYTYRRTYAPGKLLTPTFTPFYTPQQMLEMGVFEGKYLDLNNFYREFPLEWLSKCVRNGKVTMDKPNPSVNFFGVKSRTSLQVWRANGWINPQDPRGWFEWYCRFWMGRRSNDDARQIARWKSFGARHSGAILKACPAYNDPKHPNAKKRLRQRQALLQWSHNPFV